MVTHTTYEWKVYFCYFIIGLLVYFLFVYSLVGLSFFFLLSISFWLLLVFVVMRCWSSSANIYIYILCIAFWVFSLPSYSFLIYYYSAEFV